MDIQSLQDRIQMSGDTTIASEAVLDIKKKGGDYLKFALLWTVEFCAVFACDGDDVEDVNFAAARS